MALHGHTPAQKKRIRSRTTVDRVVADKRQKRKNALKSSLKDFKQQRKNVNTLLNRRKALRRGGKKSTGSAKTIDRIVADRQQARKEGFSRRKKIISRALLPVLKRAPRSSAKGTVDSTLAARRLAARKRRLAQLGITRTK